MKTAETQLDNVRVKDNDSHLDKSIDSYRRRGEVILRLVSRFRSAPDLAGILQTTAIEVGRGLEARRCSVSLDIDTLASPTSYEYCPSEFPQQNEKSATLMAPIMVQHELIGTITVQDRPDRVWATDEVTFVHTIAGQLALVLTNARLTSENQRQQREANQLRALARLTAEETDPFHLTQRLTEQAVQLLDAEQAMIGFVHDEVLLVKDFYQNGRWQPVDFEFRPGEGVAGWMMLHARPYLTRNVQLDPLIDANFVRRFDCRTVLAVPILNGLRVLGYIEIHNRRDQHPFSEENVSFVQTLAHQAAIALERTQLFEEMERRANALETLLAVSAELNEQLNPDLLIRHLVEHAASLIGATAGLGGLSEGQAIQVSGYWQTETWYKCDQQNIGLGKWVLVNKRPYLTNDYRHDEEASQELMRQFDVRAALCVPILSVTDQVLGFLELHNKGNGRDPFSWADVGMLESLANAAAVAIGNTYLFKELDNQGTQLRALSAQLVTLLEDERRRIARELHDEAGQLLIGIKLNLRILANQIPDEMPGLKKDVDQLRQEVNQATERLQALSRGLRPPTLDELGLDAAIRRLTADFEKTSNVAISIETVVFPDRLKQPVEIACYRMVQEALTNVARHSNAKKVWIKLMQEGNTLLLEIRDNGQGFNVGHTPSAGLGLLGIRERANMLGGQVRINSSAGQGTQIIVKIPVNEQ